MWVTDNNQSKDGIMDIGDWRHVLSMNNMERFHHQSLLFVPLLDSERKDPKEGHIRLGTHDNHQGEVGEQVHSQ